MVLQFHGDGSFTVPERGFWHELPLTETLSAMVYDYRTELLRDGNDRARIPEVENGYYFFYDRHSKSLSPFRDEDLFSRSSFNFTLAIYDADTLTLYYYELDT